MVVYLYELQSVKHRLTMIFTGFEGRRKNYRIDETRQSNTQRDRDELPVSFYLKRLC